MIIGIDIIFLHVKDSVKMSQWYKEMLELDVSFVTEDLTWTEFGFPGHPPATRFAIEHTRDSSSEVEQQPIMVSFRVEDIFKATTQLESKGVEFCGNPKIREEGISYFTTFRDPEGNWIQISQRK